MRKGLTYFVSLGLVAGGIAGAAVACGNESGRTAFEAAPDSGPEAASGLADGGECNTLECKRVECAPGSETTITGKVYDPAGVNPLYNVMVYIPGAPNRDAELPEIKEGVSCETCAGIALNPLVSTLTNTKGEFELKDVPVDKGVPIVVQIGKWRRKVKVDITKQCAENTVPNGELRLPKNGSEGSMPHIAVTAGGCDALECLLQGIGVDDSEFVPGASTAGHIHVFNGAGGKFAGAPEAGGGSGAVGELWNSVEKMRPYDMLMLSCECQEEHANKGGDPGTPGARQAMWDYTNLGGRLFATHYQYTWFKYSPQADWQGLAEWTPSPLATEPVRGTYDVDRSFPKGAALADWLVNVRGATIPGKIELRDVSEALLRIAPPAQSWIKDEGDALVRYFSFNTPTKAPEAEQCGRAVYGDLHLMSGGGKPFPEGCPGSGKLSPQQLAFEFMFFDLASCVQSDSTAPQPPR